jgi:multidrug efflux system membrane fusion protein
MNRHVHLIVPLAIALAGCHGGGAAKHEAAEPTVRVVHPVVRQVTDYAYFSGRTEAVQEVELQSRVTGYLESMDYTPSEEVKKGQKLFQIDPRPFQAKLEIAEAQVQLATARLALADADVRRARDLSRTPGVIAQADIDKFVAAQAEATANIAAAKSNVDAARLDVEFSTITSPIDGVAGRNYPSLGDLVKQDSTLLTTVVSQDPMYAYFEVDEQTMLRVGRLIDEGKIKSRESGAIIPVEMALADEEDEYPHRGTIDFINNRISPTTGTLELRAVFENPLLSDKRRRMFRPGMFVRVRVPIGDPFDATLVPQAAIGIDQGRKFLLVVNAKDVVEERVVELGPEEPGGLQAVYPLKGASESDVEAAERTELGADARIVVGGLQLVRPGVKVKVRDNSPRAVSE